MGRPPCCDKSNVKRGLWTAEEDAKIMAHVSKHGTGNWTLVPKKAGLNRCGKSCRLRWTNYLRPDLNHDDFTPQEEDHIINLHRAIGSRWSLIARQLPGRTDNDVKNYWNTKLRKKLSKMGIDPVTHKPISQLLSEFGSIGGLPIGGRHVISAPETAPVIVGPSLEGFEDYNSFSTVEFLSQFQPNINQETISQPLFFNEVTTSSSSSTSSSHEPRALAVPSSLVWSEFLLPEPSQHEQVDDLQAVLSQTKISGQRSTLQSDQHRANEEFGSINAGDLGSAIILGGQRENQPENSSENSFVDTILDRDNELRSAFPEFLDGSLEYY